MELYYAIMNIVDYLAINKYTPIKGSLYSILDSLSHLAKVSIEDIADANDCGKCETWVELVEEIRKLHKSGERG